jgi:NTE family protein
MIAGTLPIAAADVPVLYLPGPAPRRISPLDFTHTDSLIQGGVFRRSSVPRGSEDSRAYGSPAG